MFPPDMFALERYGLNLTHLARQGMFSPLTGYEACVNRVFEILLRKEQSNNKYNPLLFDQDEKVRWRVVIEVVRRMAVGDAPELFLSREIIALNYETLLADVAEMRAVHIAGQPSFGTDENDIVSLPSETEEKEQSALRSVFDKWREPNRVIERLRTLLLALRQTDGRVLLFANRFHYLVGIDGWNLLKPALARREIQLIAACTPEQYRDYIERDASIQRRMQEIRILSDQELQQR